MAPVDREELVEIAADLLGRLEHGIEVEAPIGRQRLGPRQNADLNAARGLDLAGQPRRREALGLELAAQTAALGVGLGETATDQRHQGYGAAERRQHGIDQP